MIYPNLITVSEADLILAPPVFDLWVAQPPQTKEFHIQMASNYVRNNWTCTGEDFDTPSLSDEAKDGVAYYAEASRAGNLYDSVSDTSTSNAGRLIESSLSAGSLSKTEKFSDTGGGGSSSSSTNPLSMADAVFEMIGCTSSGSGNTVRLIRD